MRRLTAGSAMRQLDPIAQLLLSVSPESLEHLKEARSFFEREMVRRAAELATAADVADLRAICARQASLAGDPTAFIGADMAFHTRIALITGNPIYVAVSEMMLGWLQEYHAHLLIWHGHGDRTLAEHAEVIERIEAHDLDGAEQALTRHLTRSSHLYAHPDG